jgi:ABC-type sugar transport system substrate-binding protein
MQQPRLTFACELDRARLPALFSDASVIEDLKALGAHVILMLSDLSPERAAVVQQLNAAGVPAVAVPLLPAEEGYYFTPDNTQRA